MQYVAAVLAIFLFYKFVERPHKIIFLKVMASLIVVCAFGFGIYTLIQRYPSTKTEISAKFSSHSNKLGFPTQKAIATQVFRDFQDENKYFFSKVDRNYIRYVEWSFIGSYIDAPWPFKDIIAETQEEIDAFVETLDTDLAKADSAKERYEELQRERYNRYLSHPLEGDKSSGIYPYLVEAQMNSLPEGLKSKYLDNLVDTETKEALSEIKYNRKVFEEKLRDAFNKENLESDFSIEICNNSEKTLNSYSISVSGFRNGRSTANGLRPYDSISTNFEGDIIIEPESCQTITWTSRYKFFDHYEITYVSGIWANN